MLQPKLYKSYTSQSYIPALQYLVIIVSDGNTVLKLYFKRTENLTTFADVMLLL